MTKMHLGLIVALIVLLCFVPMAGAFSGSGDGTSGDPYQITNYSQLNEMRNNYTARYILMNDIDCIGNTWTPMNHFSGNGQLNGQFYAIKNLYINTTGTYVAFMGNGANSMSHTVLENLVFYNATVIATEQTANLQPAIVISNFGSGGNVTNVYVRNIFVAFSSLTIPFNRTTTNQLRAGLVFSTTYQMKAENIGVYASVLNVPLTNTSGTYKFAQGIGELYDSAGSWNFSYSNATINAPGLYMNKYPISSTTGGVYNAYYDNQTSGVPDNGAGNSRNTGAMKTQSTYAGWDFTNVWIMSNSNGQYRGYPILRGMSDSVPPTASFTKSATSGTAPLTVTFTDTSTNTPTSWLYVFGDGSSTNATVQSPIHTFTSAGTYNVNLTATNAGGSNTSQTQAIDVGSLPVASFTKDYSIGVNPLTVQFTNTSTDALTYFWVFGDGATSTSASPAHQYTTNGVWQANLTATNTYGSNTSQTQAIDVGSLPVASFTKDHATGAAPLTVHFTDTSTNSPTEWFWVFGDTTENNTQQNPIHTFVWANTYNVYMKANNSYGWSDYSVQQPIEVGSPPIASYSRVPWSGDAPLTVVFNDTSYPYATSWDWNFGDGTHAYTKNATHVYNNAGDFDTNLTATNSYGSELTSNYNIIVDMNVSFVGAPVSGDEPLVVAFSSAATTGNPTSWFWDFGDGTNSTSQNPSHTYSHGTYSVSLLTYRSGAATAGFARSGYITANVVKPTDATWTANITSGTLAVTGHAPGRQVKFTSHSLNGTPDTFHWIIDGTYSTTEEPIVTLYDPGTIKVNVSVLNSAGSSNWYCSTYTTIGMAPSIINATVIGAPSGTVMPPTGGIAFGAGYNYLLGGDPLTFTWNFGDGTSVTRNSSGLSMFPQYEVHSFTAPGTFDVVLTLTNAWGSNHTHFSYVVLDIPPQAVSIGKWVNTKGETITSAYSTENVSFSFDTVNLYATNPPLGYYQDKVKVEYFKQDVNTLNWILINPYPYYARRPFIETTYTPRIGLFQMSTSGGGVAGIDRWVGYSDIKLEKGKYRAQLLAYNLTSSITYPDVVLVYSDITITDNPTLVSNVGDWANDVGGTGLKLIIMAIIMLILVGIPYLITRQFNIYLEVVMAVIAIGLSYFMGLIDLWVIFGLIVIAVASMFFINRGGGGAAPASSGGEIG
jgi:PKD repeat protein